MDVDGIGLGFLSENEVFHNVLDEWSMFSCFDGLGDLFDSLSLMWQFIDIFGKILSYIWVLLLRLEEVIKML